MKEYRPFLIALAVMALLSPLGLYLPRLLKAGGAWGEWSLEQVKESVGYEPAGMKEKAGAWKAPMPDYALPGRENAPLSRQSVSYVFAAAVGIAACGGAAYVLARRLARRKGKDEAGES